jgi:excisionase family DNA binding protein
MSKLTDAEVLLTPAEVAAFFRVDPKTVTRWAKAGKLTAIRTLGGHRRYRASEVHDLLENGLSVSQVGVSAPANLATLENSDPHPENQPKAVR